MNHLQNGGDRRATLFGPWLLDCLNFLNVSGQMRRQEFEEVAAMKSCWKIAVGSKNPVKIEAARAGFQKTFPDLEIVAAGYAVASGVSDQPMLSLIHI